MEKKRRIVWTFSLASFLNDMGSDMIAPIWPLFLTVFLGANMAILGFIDGLGEALVSISQALSGYLSDRLKRRKVFVWLGYLLAGLSRIGYALSPSWGYIIPFKIMDRSGKLREAPRDAIIADITSKKHRGESFGILESMDQLGAVFGIILSILLFGYLGYKRLFMLAAIPSILAVILIATMIKEPHNGMKLHKGISFKDIDKNFRLFLILSSLFALGAFSYSFLLIYAKEFGFTLTVIPVLYLIYVLSNSMSAIPFGELADRVGRKKVLLISYTFWALVCFSFIFVHSKASIYISFVLYGLHKGSLNTVQKTFVSELAPKQFRASSLGAFKMLTGLFALPASLLAGILWYKISLIVPFTVSLVLTLLAVILLFFVKE